MKKLTRVMMILVLAVVSMAAFASEEANNTTTARRRASISSRMVVRQVAIDLDADGIYSGDILRAMVTPKAATGGPVHYVIEGKTYVDVSTASGGSDCDDTNPDLFQMVLGGWDPDRDMVIAEAETSVRCVGKVFYLDHVKPYYQTGPLGSDQAFAWFGFHSPLGYSDCNNQSSLMSKLVYGGLDMDRDGFPVALGTGCVSVFPVEINGRNYYGIDLKLDSLTTAYGNWWLAVDKKTAGIQ